MLKLLLPIFLLCLSTFTFAQRPDSYELIGYATEAGGTTGGAGGTEVTVSTGTALQAAISDQRDSDSSTPLTIYIDGVITPDNSPGLSKIDVKEVRDVSIIGIDERGEFEGIGLKVFRAGNIIIRNLKVHHVRQGEKDCISIEGPADHIWIDHCELYNELDGVDRDYYDGLLDNKRDVDYVTYSWNYLHDSWKAMLVGSSESDTYNRTLTIHHNYFHRINSRLPLFRASTGHIFNNYYRDVQSTAINSRINACVKIESNYFENVQNPWVSAYSDILGGGEVSDNELVNSPFNYSDDTFELPPCSLDIPYEYADHLDSAADIPEIVQMYAGVGRLTAPSGLTTRPSWQPLTIFPNPVSSNCWINTPSAVKTAFTLKVYAISGELVYQQQYPTAQQVSLDVSELTAGLYWIKLVEETGQEFGQRVLVL